MKTLEQFNIDRATKLNAGYPKPNGIECPKCGKELYDTDCVILLSYPARRRVHCDCGFTSERFN